MRATIVCDVVKLSGQLDSHRYHGNQATNCLLTGRFAMQQPCCKSSQHRGNLCPPCGDCTNKIFVLVGRLPSVLPVALSIPASSKEPLLFSRMLGYEICKKNECLVAAHVRATKTEHQLTHNVPSIGIPKNIAPGILPVTIWGQGGKEQILGLPGPSPLLHACLTRKNVVFYAHAQ